MPLIKRNERFFGRFLHAGSPKFKLSEISLKKDVKKMLPKVCRINHKNFVFALLKTVQKQAERNSGRILRLFNCNDRVFLLLREAQKHNFHLA